MGTQLTKIGLAVKEDEPVQASVPSTPILTPKTRILDLDPRSPTADIVRTPIQIVNGINKNHTPIIGEIKSTMCNTDLNDSTSENYSVNIDPRSPSVEFTRTPIVIEKSSVKIRNKNLDNVRMQITDLSPFKKKTNASEIDKNETNSVVKPTRGPILLESSPIVRKPEQNEKRKSFVGLLETNLDYVETNLDQVSKTLQNELVLTNVTEEPKEKLEAVLENSQPSDFEENEALEDFNSEEIESKHIVENIHSELILLKNDQNQILGEVLTKMNQIEEEIKEVMETTIDPINCENTDVKIGDEISPIINLIVPVDSQNAANDFDKKVTNLIYEDQERIDSPIVKQIKLKDTNRTPLGDRNRMYHKTKSSISKLKVHDKPKSEYTVSKIPVFKDKTFKSKAAVQCENTPPTFKVAESRIKKSQWDSDKTLII